MPGKKHIKARTKTRTCAFWQASQSVVAAWLAKDKALQVLATQVMPPLYATPWVVESEHVKVLVWATHPGAHLTVPGRVCTQESSSWSKREVAHRETYTTDTGTDTRRKTLNINKERRESSRVESTARIVECIQLLSRKAPVSVPRHDARAKCHRSAFVRSAC